MTLHLDTIQKSSKVSNWIKYIFISNCLKSPPVQERFPNAISLHRESDKQDEKDSKEGFPWKHVLERIQNFSLPPKTHFCIIFVFFNVCLVFSLLHSFVWKGGRIASQATEPAPSVLPEAVAHIWHGIWTLLGLQNDSWLWWTLPALEWKANSPWCVQYQHSLLVLIGFTHPPGFSFFPHVFLFFPLRLSQAMRQIQ